MKHLMLDLETLDSEPTAAIVSIGAVFFDPFVDPQLGAQFKVNVSFKSALEYGTVSGDTLKWWFEQSTEARAHLFDPLPLPLPTALDQFSAFLHMHGNPIGKADYYVWGNGATFDNMILRHAYKKTGKTVPWGFRYDSCFRTLKNQFDPTGELYKSPDLAHDALSDAIGQAKHAIKIFEKQSKVGLRGSIVAAES